MSPWIHSMRMMLLVIVCSLLLANPGDAQSPEAESEGIKIEDGARIIELAAPPPEIASLLKQGNIRFVVGEPVRPASSLLPNGRRFEALTDYNIKYRYKSEKRWRRGSDPAELLITVQWRNVALDISHVVWFRELPDGERAWTDRLMRHELDHVRISSDPKLENQFKARLRENSRITAKVPLNETPTLASVSRLVDQHAELLFGEILSLVEIRYKELDRLTNHGQLDLPIPSSPDQQGRSTEPN